MMKNDLDFIRDKIENSGVKAPDDMDEAYVKNLLEGVEPNPAAAAEPIVKKKHKVLRFAIPAVAALLVITITLTLILRSRPEPSIALSPIEVEPSGGLSLKQFNNYDEVKTEVERLRTVNNRRYDDVIIEEDAYSSNEGSAKRGSSGSGSASGSTGGASSQPASHNETYIQVSGVEEADVILTDNHYIYCIEHNYSGFDKIVIFSAEGKDARRVAAIDAYTETGTATADEATQIPMHAADYCGISDLYLNGDRLIAICDYTDTESTEGVITMTRVNVYDVSDIEHITMLDSFSQSGSYTSSRMIDDTLYLVGTYTPWGDDVIPCCGSVPRELPADCIYGLAEGNSESFLMISAYNTVEKSGKTESKAILGGVDDIYCNKDHLYVYASYWNSDDDENVYYDRGLTDSQILKVSLNDGLAFDAYAVVSGTIDDQYALDESNGNLRVATTSTTRDWATVNNLYVLDENLRVIGSVTGFAEDESIKAVRYIGDTAYVITYEQTDPLFVIDLSTPTAPAILGEVKITGFSTMLVPVDENTLLGIGLATESGDESSMEVQSGLKLALFDISDKAHPKVLDSRTYDECYSPVQENPKALVVNPQRGDYVIPLNYAHWEEYRNSTGVYDYKTEYIGGMLNFKIENGEIVEIDRYRSDEVEEFERCAYVGDIVYMTYYDNSHQLQLKSVSYVK